MPAIQRADRLTLSPTSSYSNSLPSVEDTSILDDRVVNFGLEHLEKAVFADLLSRLRSLYQRSGTLAQRTRCRWHLGCGRVSRCQAQVNDQRRLRDQSKTVTRVINHAALPSKYIEIGWQTRYEVRHVMSSITLLESRQDDNSLDQHSTWLMNQQLISTVQRSTFKQPSSSFVNLRAASGLLPGSSVSAPRADTLIGS